MPSKSYKTRFAPSPTGPLHLGNARTALFSWLDARRNGGTFLLRMEDTDLARSLRQHEDSIIADLKWLGLDWDEGPVRQSERLEIYRSLASGLLAADRAYRCFCTPAELEERRRIALKNRRPPVYDGRCGRLTTSEADHKAESGEKFSLRFRLGAGVVKFRDKVRGDLSFDTALMGDPVIVRSDGTPVYLFASAVDDHEMGVTQVIRGEDLLDQTPRQISIFESMLWDPPSYAHLPLVSGESGDLLSKRAGSTSLGYFRDLGVLPEALINYLALLGWAAPDAKEVFSTAELVAGFDLARVGTSPSRFDTAKLKWLNREHLRITPADELVAGFGRYLPAFVSDPRGPEWKRLFAETFRGEVGFLSEIAAISGFVWKAPELSTMESTAVSEMREILGRLDDGSGFGNLYEAVLNGEAGPIVDGMGVSLGKALKIVRQAVTGLKKGIPLKHVAGLLGREEFCSRLKRAASA